MRHNDEASVEFLTGAAVFERTAMIRRTSDLNKKVVRSNSSLVLPKNPMLHIVDNVGHSDSTTDTFNIDNYPFLYSKNTVKYIHNFVDFSAVSRDDLVKFSHRIFRPHLVEKLKAFGVANRKIMIPELKLDPVIGNKNCIILENYNPLYRIITTSTRPISQYYRYRAIMTTVLKNTLNYDRNHFLVLPVPDLFTYMRSNIMGIVQSGEISSPRLLSSSHFYFFIIDLITFLLNNQSPISTLNKLDKRHLSALNVMLINKDRAIIFNVGKLATLAKSKTYVFSFINNISRMSGVDVPIVELPDADEDPGIEESEHEGDETNEVPVSSVIHNRISPNNDLPVSSILAQKVSNIVDLPGTRISTQTPVSTTNVSKEIFQEERETPPQPEEVSQPEEKVPDIRHTPITHVDTAVLSVKQKERIEKLSVRYKDIVVQSTKGSQTLHQILQEHVDIAVEPTPINIENTEGIDKNMLESTTKSFDQHYAEKLLRKDIVSNVIAFKENGLFLTGYEEKNDYSSFTRIKHVKASFTDVKGKKHTVNFKLPMPDAEGYYLVNGVRLSMSKQLVNIPICKISPVRVSLISNYNKTLVEKVVSSRHSLPEYLAAKSSDLGITLVPKHTTYIGIEVPYDYKQLGGTYSKIITPTHEFYFGYSDRYEFFNPKTSVRGRALSSFEKQYGVIVGKVKDSSHEFVFMNQKNICTTVNIDTANVTDHDKHIVNYLGNISIPSEWCNLKILDKNIPIAFILSYRYGLTAVLTNMKIKHRFVPLRGDLNLAKTELVLNFADGRLVFDRYPLEHSYILSGFSMFPTLKRYALSDFDGKDVYYSLLSDRGMSINYLKGIDNHFSFFIDPITKEILEQMHEPTNTRDLLIRAVDMLVTSTDKVPSALSNFRVRSAEKIPAMIYNEISRQYANYVNSNFKDVSFSINTEAIFQRLVQDETMTLREDLNPVHSVKEKSKVAYSGFGGRSSEAFVARDRKYPKDAIGILGESTPDGPNVGMVSALSGNPKIKNLRGMFNLDTKETNTVNVLSDTSLLMPGLTHDDPKRSAFCAVQLTHHIPTPNMKPMRMRTGYETVIPQKTSELFVGKARFDGKVISIDESLKLVTVSYKNKTVDVFEYGDIQGEASGMTVNHTISLKPGLKVGSVLKPGDVVVYHKEFFQYDPISKQLSWCHGIPTTIAIMAKDVTLEDSAMISSALAEKMKFDSIYQRAIQVSTDMIVSNFSDVGTTVKFNDSLIRLKYEDTANVIGEVDELFDDLKQVDYRSKHDGVVVSIQVYHVAESLNDSLTKFINRVMSKSRKKSNAAKGSLKEEAFSTVVRVPEGTRIRGVQLGEADLLVVFSIKTKVACGIGDKIICDSSLKSVVGRVEDKPMITEEGKVVDMVFGANSVFNRVILSPIISGVCDRVLEAAEEDVLKMYFEE